MTLTAPERTSATGRRAGYVVAVVVNALMLYAVNGWPGWDAVPFLTDATPQVLGWVNASILVNLLANMAYLTRDPPRLRALGDLVTTGVGLLAMVRIWQVFPLDVEAGWETVARVLLVVGIVGSGIGMVVALGRLVRGGDVGS